LVAATTGTPSNRRWIAGKSGSRRRTTTEPATHQATTTFFYSLLKYYFLNSVIKKINLGLVRLSWA
jgi:hypothetical protein